MSHLLVIYPFLPGLVLLPQSRPCVQDSVTPPGQSRFHCLGPINCYSQCFLFTGVNEHRNKDHTVWFLSSLAYGISPDTFTIFYTCSQSPCLYAWMNNLVLFVSDVLSTPVIARNWISSSHTVTGGPECCRDLAVKSRLMNSGRLSAIDVTVVNSL